MFPKTLSPLYSRADIDRAAERLGGLITPWAEKCYQQSKQDILTIPILRGGLFFFADLVRHIDMSVEIAPARTWAYEEQVSGVPKKDVKVNIDQVPAAGRSILLVDDICDSGRTLATIKEELMKRGATEVCSAVLIKRVIPNAAAEPTWYGFAYEGAEWLVGYGMDDGDRWRNLPAVYLLNPQQNKAVG
jgi:hypoxanthine phosphoribosyltransferase